MQNLRDMRNRIVAVQTAVQVFDVMQRVSNSRLKRTNNSIRKIEPYVSGLNRIFCSISPEIAEDGGMGVKALEERKVDRALVVCITSNKTKCGAFNRNVVSEAEKAMAVYHASPGKESAYLFPIGKIGADVFKKGKHQLEKSVAFPDNPTFNGVGQVAETLMGWFAQGKYDRVEIVYCRLEDKKPVVFREQFLPLVQKPAEKGSQGKNRAWHLLEPSIGEIADYIAKSLPKARLFEIFLNSYAAESRMRVIAVGGMVQNANKLVCELKIGYNKARQAKITNELIEIISGADFR
ncbi:MAG: F0F1 ATP synthase subunit gamma [Candidatus Micrarchaeota archaeon]|nr:F0F1 ATP synthase subunit gamma [Candidatus Micrarchaeota archaeon]